MRQKPHAGAPVVQPGSELEHPTSKPATRQARWQAANPLARWAHLALASGIRRGLVERRPCEVCGAEPADAHHDDYARPLAVRFLCRRHHRGWHAQAGEAK
jgi:hypothetical protein